MCHRRRHSDPMPVRRTCSAPAACEHSAQGDDKEEQRDVPLLHQVLQTLTVRLSALAVLCVTLSGCPPSLIISIIQETPRAGIGISGFGMCHADTYSTNL